MVRQKITAELSTLLGVSGTTIKRRLRDPVHTWRGEKDPDGFWSIGCEELRRILVEYDDIPLAAPGTRRHEDRADYIERVSFYLDALGDSQA